MKNKPTIHDRLEFFLNRTKDLEIIIEQLLITSHLPPSNRRRIEAHNLAQRAITKERIDALKEAQS